MQYLLVKVLFFNVSLSYRFVQAWQNIHGIQHWAPGVGEEVLDKLSLKSYDMRDESCFLFPDMLHLITDGFLNLFCCLSFNIIEYISFIFS